MTLPHFRRLAAAKLVAVSMIAGAGAGVVATQLTAPHSSVPVSLPSVHAQAEQAMPNGGFSTVVRRATPSVVNISTRTSRPARRQTRGRMMPGLPPGFEDFFGGQEPEQQQPRRGSSLGSGVIVDNQGHIITNAHVVEGATEVKVSLSDRRELDAKIIGSDPQTDIAVLQVTEKNLPALTLGDSSKAVVGDLALAIGNPFGIGQTVTMGIVGATGRSGLGIEAYEDFIQTDAAINPGNSGGALVNTRGELIGINTAILAGGGGGNQGIGFAIPINMAREVMDQLIKSGKVTRGYMGASLQEITAAVGRSLNVAANSGVILTEIVPNSPAQKAGLQAGDIVTALNGTAVTDLQRLRLTISRTSPGTIVRLAINRDGQKRELPVTLEAFPSDPNATEPNGITPERGRPTSMEGVEVESLTPQIASQLQAPEGTKGVVVTSVDQESAAANSGLRRGDIIQSVNRRPVTNETDFNAALGQAGDRAVLLLVRRGQGTTFLPIEPNRR